MTKERLIELTNDLQEQLIDANNKLNLIYEEDLHFMEYAKKRYQESVEECLEQGIEHEESDRLAMGVYDNLIDRYNRFDDIEYYQERIKYLTEQLEIYTLAMNSFI